jgi:hypothetical protein
MFREISVEERKQGLEKGLLDCNTCFIFDELHDFLHHLLSSFGFWADQRICTGLEELVFGKNNSFTLATMHALVRIM